MKKDEYEGCKRFYLFMFDQIYGNFVVSEKAKPQAILAEFEKKSFAEAKKSLEAGIGDILTQCAMFDRSKVESINASLVRDK